MERAEEKSISKVELFIINCLHKEKGMIQSPRSMQKYIIVYEVREGSAVLNFNCTQGMYHKEVNLNNCCGKI